MELNLQEQPKKKPKLKDVPFTMCRILKKIPPIEGVTNTSRNFPCTRCNKTFKRGFDLNRHINLHTGECEVTKTPRKFLCTMCNKTFKRGFDLRRHINLHTGERIYKCEVCEKIFLDSSTLSQHRRIHSGVKPWPCKFCKICFGTLHSLRRHITIHNTEGRPYECKKCKKRFPDQSSTKNHKCIHTGIKRHVCNVCLKTFVNNKVLNAHQKIHAKVKPFNCQHCGKGFTQRSNFSRHLHIHEGDNVFSCTVCGVSYSVEICLRRHLRTHGLVGKKAAIKQKALLDDNNSDELFERDSLEETADDPSETSKKLATTDINKVTSTKMKKLSNLQKRLQPVKLDNPIAIEAEAPQPITNAEVYETTEPQTEIVKIGTIQAEKDTTVLPPLDESISREKTAEDATSLLNCEVFGSTKDIPPRLKSLNDVLSSQLLSFLSNMCKSEHICSTDASDLLSEVLNSLNSGNVNSSNESVITIISIS